ncbi:hypothetical protein EJB05_02552, partial [Eragrostis curvula]
MASRPPERAMAAAAEAPCAPDAAGEGSSRAPPDAAEEEACLAPHATAGESPSRAPPDLARHATARAREAAYATDAGVEAGGAAAGSGARGTAASVGETQQGGSHGTGGAGRSSAGEAAGAGSGAARAGSGAALGSGSHMDEAGSSFTGKNASQPQMTINFRVPGYTAYMDDGGRVEFENIDHIVELNETDGYTMCNLMADLANKTKWGTCQEPVFWYWDFEKKGLQLVVTNDDLSMVFQK